MARDYLTPRRARPGTRCGLRPSTRPFQTSGTRYSRRRESAVSRATARAVRRATSSVAGDRPGRRQDPGKPIRTRNLRGPSRHRGLLGAQRPPGVRAGAGRGQWRICDAPSELLLTQAQFADDYELRNLYFFDPDDRFLVPDPVYVPLEASTTSLTKRLLQELQTPPVDWLAGGATQTAIPGATGHRRAGGHPGHGEPHRDDHQSPERRGGVATAVDAGRRGPGRLPGGVGRADRERQAVLSGPAPETKC